YKNVADGLGQVGILKGGIVRIDIYLETGYMFFVYYSLKFPRNSKIPRSSNILDILGIGLRYHRQEILKIRGWRIKTNIHFLIVLVQFYESIEHQGQLIDYGLVLQKGIFIFI